jgi:hypothetical protein
MTASPEPLGLLFASTPSARSIGGVTFRQRPSSYRNSPIDVVIRPRLATVRYATEQPNPSEISCVGPTVVLTTVVPLTHRPTQARQRAYDTHNHRGEAKARASTAPCAESRQRSAEPVDCPELVSRHAAASGPAKASFRLR